MHFPELTSRYVYIYFIAVLATNATSGLCTDRRVYFFFFFLRVPPLTELMAGAAKGRGFKVWSGAPQRVLEVD